MKNTKKKNMFEPFCREIVEKKARKKVIKKNITVILVEKQLNKRTSNKSFEW